MNGQHISFHSIFADMKMLLKNKNNARIIDEFNQALENFDKEYDDIYITLVQYNSIIDLIVNNTNLEEFDKFANDYCHYVSDLCILNNKMDQFFMAKMGKQMII